MPKALTKPAVEKLKPHPTRRLEVPDALLPGLYLVVQPLGLKPDPKNPDKLIKTGTGAKSWAVRYRFRGKPKKHTLGSLAALDLKKAREHARDSLELVTKGLDPAGEKKRARKEAADARDEFQLVAEQFVQRYAKPKNKSWQQSTWTLGLKPDPENPDKLIKTGNGVVAKWEGKRVQDITKRDVIDLIDGIVDRGAPVMANRTLTAVRKLYNWCKERDIVSVSPCDGVKAPGTERARERALSDAELRLLWKAADEDDWPFGPLTKLLILTGQRRAEVGGMRWPEVNLGKKTWSIPSGRTKNNRAHEVPLADAAMALVKKLPKIKGEAGLVFTTNGKRPVSGFTRAKDRLAASMLAAMRKAALDPKKVKPPEPWTFHDLRRTAASGMARLGQPVHVTEAVLNHKSGTIKGVAAVYNKYDYSDEKRSALAAWARYVTTLVEGKAGNVVELKAKAAKR